MDARKITKLLYILILIFGISNGLGLPEKAIDGEGATNTDSEAINTKCPNITAMPDFDVDKFYNGKSIPWYEIEKSPKRAEQTTDCAKMNINLVADSDPPKANFMFYYANEADFLSFQGLINSDSEIPYVPITFDSDDTESLFYILDTDYENYALAYSCSSDPNNNKQNRIWLLSRSKQPENYTWFEEAAKEQNSEFQEKFHSVEGCEEIHDTVFCRDLSNMQELNLGKLTQEEWFEQVRSLNDWENDKVCGNFSFAYDNGAKNFNFVYTKQDGSQAFIAFNVKTTNDSEIIFENSGKTYYYITDTDYKNYAVIYSCDQKSKSEIRERLWLLGQYEEINSAVMEKVNKEFKDLLQANLTCPVPEAPPTTTTPETTKVPTDSATDESSEVTTEAPISTTDVETNSTAPGDRPPAYRFQGSDNIFYFMFDLEKSSKTKNMKK